MTKLEIAAALFGIINLLLLRQRSVWNFPFGIAAVAIFFHIFWQSDMPSDAGLQIFFVILQLYGWWAWFRAGHEDGTIIVHRLSTTACLGWIAISIIATGGWGWLMDVHTSATHPWWDAAIAMFSVTAQILMTQRCLENWHWWIFVNIISIPLYVIKGLEITAGLYVIYLALAVAGLIEWRRTEKQT